MFVRDANPLILSRKMPLILYVKCFLAWLISTGITVEMLCTSESLELVGNIRDDHRYQSTDIDISDTYKNILGKYHMHASLNCPHLFVL